MGSKNSNFWIGLGVGSILGAIAYRCACSSKGKELEHKVFHALHKMGGRAEEMLDAAREKALYAGEKVADKVAVETLDIAEKANEMKKKVHSFAEEKK